MRGGSILMGDSMKVKILVFALSFIALWNSLVHGDEAPPSPISVLCASGVAEGTYNIHLEKIGRVAIYIICQGASDMVAAMTNSNVENPIEFAYTAIDGDILSFVTHPLGADDAKTIGYYFTDGRIQVSIA